VDQCLSVSRGYLFCSRGAKRRSCVCQIETSARPRAPAGFVPPSCRKVERREKVYNHAENDQYDDAHDTS
jgi:hypothetical protein